MTLPSSTCGQSRLFLLAWLWDGEMSPFPSWNISAPDTNYWPFLPCYIYSQSGRRSRSSCISYSLPFLASRYPALLHTLELYFCVSSVSPPTRCLLSLSSSVSPFISLCQKQRPLCLHVGLCLMVDLSGCDGSFLSSPCHRLFMSVFSVSRRPLRGKCPHYFSALTGSILLGKKSVVKTVCSFCWTLKERNMAPILSL